MENPKSLIQINEARSAVDLTRLNTPTNNEQYYILVGISVALCWMAGSPNGSTLQRLIDGDHEV